MKKYILLIVSAVVFAFTSCTSSEDIEIVDIEKEFQVSFKVNPSTVVSPYTWEVNAGELSAIPNNAKLRIRTLIYDADGNLKYEAPVKSLSNYQSKVDFVTNLEKGNYTCVAISDVVGSQDGKDVEFWSFSNNEHLNQAKIEPTTWFGNKYNILGVASKNITITGMNDEVIIDIKPAGAVIYTFYDGLDRYNDIEQYRWVTNQKVSALFDNSGNLIPVVYNNNNFINDISFVSPKEVATYRVSFMLPQTNPYFQLYGINKDTKEYMPITNEFNISSIKAGEQYMIFTSLVEDEEALFYSNITGLTFPDLGLSKTARSLYDEDIIDNILHLRNVEK